MDNGESSYRRYLDGDDKGLLTLIDEYKTGLVLYVNSIVCDLGLAEEIMIDTFAKLAVKKPRFRGEGSFKTWLYAIGKNLAFDTLKKAGRGDVPLEEAERYTDDGRSVEEDYLRTERNIALRRVLDGLKHDYRSAVWLVYFENFSPSEAARVMKMTRRRFTTLLYRAKKSLKERLEKEGICNDEF